VIILDNSITGMTGHQDNPLTGRTIKGDPALAIDLEMLVKSLGIERFTVVDPNDMEETEKVIRTELEAPGPSVVVARRPCALLKYVKHNAPLHVDTEKCRSCRMCMRIGCPAISFIDGKARINAAQCVGCGVCRQLCKFGAIG
jgi:indolepyruvate ferredoxin oxidoreductase alpha subunit